MQFIDLKKQYEILQSEIDGRMRAVLTHGQFIMGPEIAELEQKLAAYVGVKHCITVASGTASLEIALRALKIGPGDEVISVPFTWISSSETINLVGATPVFVDIDLATYNLNPELLEAKITEKTKAIVPVSLFGQMADLKEIGRIAAKYQIPVIEDAAQSLVPRNMVGRVAASLKFPVPVSFRLSHSAAMEMVEHYSLTMINWPTI